MSGRNEVRQAGIIFTEDEINLLLDCVKHRMTKMQRMSRWHRLTQNLVNSHEYVRLLKLRTMLSLGLVSSQLAKSPLGVPPRGARGLSSPPEDA